VQIVGFVIGIARIFVTVNLIRPIYALEIVIHNTKHPCERVGVHSFNIIFNIDCFVKAILKQISIITMSGKDIKPLHRAVSPIEINSLFYKTNETPT